MPTTTLSACGAWRSADRQSSRAALIVIGLAAFVVFNIEQMMTMLILVVGAYTGMFPSRIPRPMQRLADIMSAPT